MSKKQTPSGTPKITEIAHGKYTIKAGMMGGVAIARAFHNGEGAERGIVSEAQAKTPEAAVEALQGDLDARDAKRIDARTQDDTLGFTVPTTDEYGEALAGLSLTEKQRDMLTAHAGSGAHGMSAAELADVVGYANQNSANLHYSKVGAAIAEFVGVALPKTAMGDDERIATGVLATAGSPRDNGEFVWIMRSELVQAIEARAE